MSTDGQPRSVLESVFDVMKFAIWPILVVGMFVFFYFYARPTPGAQALRLSRDAVQQATSWHTLTSTHLSDGSWMKSEMRDLVCPTDFDRTTLHVGQTSSIERKVEFQGTFYSQLPTGEWQRLLNGLIRIRDCGRGPYLESLGYIYSDLDEIARTGEIRMGGLLDSNGVKCQWWHLSAAPPTASDAKPKYSVCVDESTHLPLLATSETLDFSYNFSKWNQITISAPTPADTQLPTISGLQ